MSIELKLSAKQLGVIAFHLKSLEKETLHSRQGKVARSILDKLVIRFNKRYLDVVNNPSKTKRGQIKKYKFSVEYHEAHYLEAFVAILENKAMSEYDHNVLHFIKSTLNQQLA